MSNALTGLYEPLLELIRRTSTDLPGDIDEAITQARSKEEPGSAGENVFNIILQNIEMSRAGTSPLCQDTGMATFYVHHPSGFSQVAFKRVAERAVVAATKDNCLRPNSVDSLTGESVLGHAGVSLRGVGKERDRHPPAAQGGRVRKRWIPVFPSRRGTGR